MTLRYLLDTSTISAPVSKGGSPGIARKLTELGHACALPAPAWHELVFGVARLPVGARRATLEAYLHDVIKASFPILAYDELAAAWHGSERARLESMGTPAPFVDGQIAAIAVVHGLVLVTANTEDFKHFARLETVDWATTQGRPREPRPTKPRNAKR